MLNVFIILIITSTLIYSHNNPKNINYLKPDSNNSKNFPFHYLTPDSLGWDKLPKPEVFKYYQDGFKNFPKQGWDQSSGRILIYRPDSSIIYSMPEFIPDSTIKYNMPKAQSPKEFPILVPKDFKNDNPKKYFERKG